MFAEHELGRELKLMSDWLDEHPEVLEGVAADLGRDRVVSGGRILQPRQVAGESPGDMHLGGMVLCAAKCRSTNLVVVVVLLLH